MVRGVLLGFAAFALFAVSDACVKLIRGELPVYESAFFGAMFGLVVVPFLLRDSGRWRDLFLTANRPLWLLRFCVAPAGVIGSVTAFTHLPMAEAFVLIFLLPAFTTLLSVLFLRERVGIWRWSAVILGFIGVLIVLQPGFREVSIGHLGALVAGFSGAVGVVALRAMVGRENGLSLYGAGVLGSILVCGGLSVQDFLWPTAEQWAKLAGYGLLAAGANLLIMRAAHDVPAAILGPTQYSQMLWAILLGALLFGDGIDLPMLAGIALIVGSGLLSLKRDTPLSPRPGAPDRPLFRKGS